MKNHAPTINPYVTSRGGVVILNGPFPIDQAKQVAALCKAAPDLLNALMVAVIHLEDIAVGKATKASDYDMAYINAAIAKARPA